MEEDRDLLPISALQHLQFCERQCALIHLEGLWAENRRTVEGRLLHERVHEAGKTVRGAIRHERGLQLCSQRLGLFGIADMVEFDPGGPPHPIEYKRGRPKAHDADEVQLCAQAMCLEEMLSCHVPAGELFYGTIRRRVEVIFSVELRARTEAAAARLHELISHGRTPIARRELKCDRCSLLHQCIPGALKARATARRYLDDAVEMILQAE
ncbi:MAG: CRISPR-associated protein Cas4 [Acidobacteria bacterium]|nr:CRISPR-associated protein Cas4 [Acidobacteriota bacterium]